MYLKAQIETARSDCKTLLHVVDAWSLNHPGAKHCPTIADLKNDKALSPDQNVADPWGTDYAIVCVGDEYGTTSAGPDKKWNTADDLWAGAKPPAAKK